MARQLEFFSGARSPRSRFRASTRLSRLVGASLLLTAIVAALGAAPAAANVAGVQISSSTKTVNADGTVTVTFGGTWLWTSLHATANNQCDHRIGVGWSVIWNDPNDPGFVMKLRKSSLVENAGSTGSDGLNPEEQVLYNQSQPCGTFVETDAPRFGDGNAQGNWSDTHVYKDSGSVPGVICVVLYDLAFPPAPPRPNRLLVTNDDNTIAASLRVDSGWTPTPGDGNCTIPGQVVAPVVTAKVTPTTTSPPVTAPPTTTPPPPVVRASGPLAYTGPGDGLVALGGAGALALMAGLVLLAVLPRRRTSSAGPAG